MNNSEHFNVHNKHIGLLPLERYPFNFALPALLTILLYYTYTYNEKYFQKVSFCVITHPIGQNRRAVCKKHVTMEMHEAQSAAHSARPAGHRSRVRVRVEYSLGAGRPSAQLASYSLASLALISQSCAGASINAGLSGVKTSSLYSQAGLTGPKSPTSRISMLLAKQD